jgi:curved DNA-binding protein CbpA
VNADPYAILELPWGASEHEVRQAFKRLALRYHPDRNGGSAEAEARFKLLSAAYQRLKSAGFRLPGPPPRAARDAPPPGPSASRASWRRDEGFTDAEESAWEPPPRPEFWPDGARIHYPTQREIDELMRSVNRSEAPSWFRRWASRLLQGVAYLYVGLLVLCVVAGAALLAVIVVLGVRDWLGLD